MPWVSGNERREKESERRERACVGLPALGSSASRFLYCLLSVNGGWLLEWRRAGGLLEVFLQWLLQESADLASSGCRGLGRAWPGLQNAYRSSLRPRQTRGKLAGWVCVSVRPEKYKWSLVYNSTPLFKSDKQVDMIAKLNWCIDRHPDE